MRLNNICGIYSIFNIINNKQYVGSSKNIRRRIKEHYRDLQNNKHHSQPLQNAWNKYGKYSFEFKILEITDNLNEKEQYWIDYNQSHCKKKGYNVCPIANSIKGRISTLETRLKISNYQKGRPKTKEHNLKNSLTKLGNLNPNFEKPISNILREAIINSNFKRRLKYTFINPKGEIISFIGLAEFCRNNNLNAGSMSLVYSGKIKQHKGWIK